MSLGCITLQHTEDAVILFHQLSALSNFVLAG